MGSDSTSGTDKRQRISISMPTLGSSNTTAKSDQMAAGDEAVGIAWHGEATASGEAAADGEAVVDDGAARGDGKKKRKHKHKQSWRTGPTGANRGESSQEVE